MIIPGFSVEIHHLAYWLDQRLDVERAADMLMEAGVPIEYGPGRHGMGFQTYLYFREPGGMRIELNSGGWRNYQPDWQPVRWTPAQGSNDFYRQNKFPDSMMQAFPPPTFAKYGYPQLAESCVTDQAPALIKKYPGLFVFQQSTTTFAKGAITVLKQLKDGGQIGNKVSVVNVGDDFGIELANAGRPLFKEAGFEIVYDKSYPLGTQDYAPVMKAAKAANPDAFVAWSYPPDTFGLADQAKIEGLNVKAYYSAVATAYQGFAQKFGPAAENVLGAGGMVDTPQVRDFYKRHKEVTGIDADYWGSPFYYASLEVLTQSIEAVGSMDREAIAAHIRDRKFKTFLGELSLPGQIIDKVYTVGQWQGGFFRAVAGVGFSDYAQVNLKTSWG